MDCARRAGHSAQGSHHGDRRGGHQPVASSFRVRTCSAAPPPATLLQESRNPKGRSSGPSRRPGASLRRGTETQLKRGGNDRGRPARGRLLDPAQQDAGKYEFTATVLGPVVGLAVGGSVVLGARRPTQPSPADVNSGTGRAIYTVASFHTHIAHDLSPGTAAVGPSECRPPRGHERRRRRGRLRRRRLTARIPGRSRLVHRGLHRPRGSGTPAPIAGRSGRDPGRRGRSSATLQRR